MTSSHAIPTTTTGARANGSCGAWGWCSEGGTLQPLNGPVFVISEQRAATPPAAIYLAG